MPGHEKPPPGWPNATSGSNKTADSDAPVPASSNKVVAAKKTSTGSSAGLSKPVPKPAAKPAYKSTAPRATETDRPTKTTSAKRSHTQAEKDSNPPPAKRKYVSQGFGTLMCKL